MQWHDEPDVARRDDRLGRVRRLTMLMAGGATAASLGLATVLGVVIPGRAATTSTQAPAGQSGGGSGQPSGGAGRQGSGGEHNSDKHNAGKHNAGKHNAGDHSGRKHGAGGLKPPSQPPSGASSPPVVSSGGS